MRSGLAVIEINKYLSVPEVAKHLPGRPHVSTVIRWIRHGVNGTRLPAIRCGSRFFVDPEALADFLHDQNSKDRHTEPSRLAAMRSDLLARGLGADR